MRDNIEIILEAEGVSAEQILDIAQMEDDKALAQDKTLRSIVISDDPVKRNHLLVRVYENVPTTSYPKVVTMTPDELKAKITVPAKEDK